jgi:MarR family transcriptional regulator for hemolysin
VLEHDVETSIGYWAFVVSRDFERAVNEELAPHGITLRQFQVLAWLAFRKELTQAELSDLMRVEPPTLVRILDRMERDGWIRRHSVAGDRRKKLIRPTPHVKPVWEQIRRIIFDVRARATSGVPPKKLDAAREVLQAIHENFATPAPVGELAS